MPDIPSEIRSLVEEIEALQGAEPVRQLRGGRASDTWLLQTSEQRLVLRIDKPLAQSLGLDRQSELEILKVVGNAGIGPELVWADPARGIQICHYISGEAWTAGDAKEPARLQVLAQTLKRLHGLPPAGRAFDPAAAARRYAAEIATPQATQIAGHANSLAARLFEENTQQVLCHNDLVHGNIIGNRAVKLIDWEYAAVGDPYFDLAVVIRHHQLPQAVTEGFLQAYAGQQQPLSTARLTDFCTLYDLLSGLWYLSMVNRFGANSPFDRELQRVLLRLKATGLLSAD